MASLKAPFADNGYQETQVATAGEERAASCNRVEPDIAMFSGGSLGGGFLELFRVGYTANTASRTRADGNLRDAHFTGKPMISIAQDQIDIEY